MDNRLSDLVDLSTLSKEDIDNAIFKLKKGTIVENTIATAAEKCINSVYFLEKYQKSKEWEKLYWGRRFVKYEGKIFYITNLRYKEDDFKSYPFFGYLVTGKRKFSFRSGKKNISNNDWYVDIKFTWEQIRSFTVIKIPAQISERLEIITNKGAKP